MSKPFQSMKKVEPNIKMVFSSNINKEREIAIGTLLLKNEIIELKKKIKRNKSNKGYYSYFN